jgi:DNA-binding transcriptional ArsR family regulator
MTMLADADLAMVASVIGDQRRASMLLALLGGEELAARELAARAGASSSLASAHLSKLLHGGLLEARRVGRERRYRIASPAVAQALEALLAIAPTRAARTLRESSRGQAIRRARTCYDHLAGELGVGLTEALQRQRVIIADDGAYSLTPSGEKRLQLLGIDTSELRKGRRALTRQCLDWTERRPHLAGALGAGISERLLELRWLRRVPSSRAVIVTSSGRRELQAHFALDLP